MEQNQTKKLSFFKKVWYSITKFEKYPEMAAEGIGKAIKYLFIITLIVCIFSSIGSLITLKKLVENLADYINTSIPEFTYSNETLTMDIEEPIIIEQVDYSGLDKVIINPLSEVNEIENKTVGTTLVFLKNKVQITAKTENNETSTQEYSYTEFITSYTQEQIDSFNKTELVNYLNSDKMNSYYGRYLIAILMYVLMLMIVTSLLDALELAVLGWVTAIVARLRISFSIIYNMAIHALTIPMILNILYIFINYFTDFTVTYFQVAYVSIAYICLAAAIFMAREDLLKRQQEVDKIVKEQENVKKEIEQQEREG